MSWRLYSKYIPDGVSTLTLRVTKKHCQDSTNETLLTRQKPEGLMPFVFFVLNCVFGTESYVGKKKLTLSSKTVRLLQQTLSGHVSSSSRLGLYNFENTLLHYIECRLSALHLAH